MTYWTPEELTKLHILRRNGKRPAEIAGILGRSEQAVKDKLTKEKRRGMKFGKLAHKARKYNSEIAKKWRQLVREGKHYKDIFPQRPATVCEILAMEARGEL